MSINKSNFNYPSIYSFPPFFTKQTNISTWQQQSKIWQTLILEYFKFNKEFELVLNVGNAHYQNLFYNKSINRSLKPEIVREIIDLLVGQGVAKYEDPNLVIILGKSIEEWGIIIYQWVSDTGSLNSVLTQYELTQGDLVTDTEFYQLHPTILKWSLEDLATKGKCQLFKGNESDEFGVKFF
ncbi:ESCRT-II complex, vps25 subunit [Conidiobolus coronatus NRRL 28638]|uniref:ESCRT-II complex subunit VPS25 n=1 Tax=Conidiobolus coronatus (strain ATCC 28846 / CBS 209.66 / NRRL 28638) TaxID=796925 RepID=A0A137NU18_CONC2|nr:ESCRT-II complex, vps25 subunit [Conidiobolus coronatus NRRL 28638]|eukprot:KXN66226.1 ESCRT-II complex, vps25 subunit [Conidiobolus coronatus NRRL 28638]